MLELSPGTRLGPYDVISPLGAGGMGEVYRARDSRLGRDVALKILPQAFATDPDRLMRFEREARTLAALNHPRIASIYGLEETTATGSGGACARALVMELVEGEDLSARIARGPIPFDEALPIAQQIAEALEAAHEVGIIHRDLKPANIKVRADGTVKVLDFGLAKAFETGPEVLDSADGNWPDGGPPTVTSPAMTMRGVVLGTAAYMAPEQARGRAVDRRADIWAFGAVIYEMLTARRAFQGEDVTDTLASVLRSEPDYSALSVDVPRPLRSLVRRCLTKDVRQRARDIGDIRIQLEELRNGTGIVEESRVAAVVAARPGPPRWTFAAAAGALVVALAGLAAWSRPGSVPAPVMFRGTVDLEIPGQTWTGMGPGAIISRDGTTLAITVDEPGKPNRIFIRRLDQPIATLIPGTDGARNPFFSRDAQWLAFFADGKLKKVSLSGGSVTTLADAPEDRGGTWTEDDTIVFAPNGRSPLRRVPAGGGAVEDLTQLQDGDSGHRFPQMLPGGRGVIYSLMRGSNQAIVVQSLDGGGRKVLQEQASSPHYLVSGHVAFVRDSTLHAAPFDLATLSFSAPPIPVIESVRSASGPGAAQIAFSDRGPAVYVKGGVGKGVEMVWLTADGMERPVGARLANYRDPRLSPDGRKVAVTVLTSSGDIWVYDVERGAMSRVTFDASNEVDPVWSPDGEHIAFTAVEPGQPATVFLKRADGSGAAQKLLTSEQDHNLIPFSWHPRGRALALIRRQPGAYATASDVIVTEFTGDVKAGLTAGRTVAFASSPFNESEPAFSPDGKWLAYQSNETGRNEVYVSGYPGPSGRSQVSIGGGMFPTWGHDGRTLYFKTTDQQIMAAAYSSAGGTFEVSAPRPWSPARLDDLGAIVRSFDVHPDGRMLALRVPDDERSTTVKFNLIPDFLADLGRLARGAK